MYMIRTPEPTASQGWGWQSGLVALRMGGFPSRSPGSPPLLTSALSRSPRKKFFFNNFKNEKKQARAERVGFQKSGNRTAERWLRGNYSDCGRAHYVVSGICIFGCANCLDVFKYGCASLICLSTSLNVPSLLNQNVNPVESNGCASQLGKGEAGCARKDAFIF